MHRYRSHTCGALRDSDIGQTARLSGWCHRIRDHGGVLFIDLRDHYGITQVVADPDSPAFKDAEKLRSEWVVRIDGKVRHIVERLRVGNAYVNRNMIGAVVGVQPFGGEGLSGTGPKAGGPHTLLRFAVERALSVNIAAQGGDPALLNLG